MSEKLRGLIGEGEQRFGFYFGASYVLVGGAVHLLLSLLLEQLSLGIGEPWLVGWGVLLVGLVVLAWSKGWGKEFVGGFISGTFFTAVISFPVVLAVFFITAALVS